MKKKLAFDFYINYMKIYLNDVCKINNIKTLMMV